jgi:hypothetical protein
MMILPDRSGIISKLENWRKLSKGKAPPPLPPKKKSIKQKGQPTPFFFYSRISVHPLC